jgi:hypothetical protein
MKPIALSALFIAVGLIVAAGCISTTSKNAVNETTNAGSAQFANTPDPGVNKTITATANVTTSDSGSKGSLRVSISGISYPANLSVILDNEPVGAVQPATPLYLMVPEGNHTVMVCADSVCEQEKVTIRFGKYISVDFSERILKEVEFPDPLAQPSARIIDYYKNGNAIVVNVEFFNPSKEDLLMSASVSCGYSYIDDRTSIKMGDCAKGTLVQHVKAGQRITEDIALYFVSGRSYSYSIPVINELTIK